jgi:type IV secretion system protein VirD4
MRVRIQTRWGSQMVGAITEPVPDRLAHLPQYRSGMWSYIKGYHPKLK